MWKGNLSFFVNFTMNDTNWHYHKLHNKLLKISCNNSYSWTCNFWINFIHEYQHFTHNRWYLYIIMIFSSKCIFKKFLMVQLSSMWNTNLHNIHVHMVSCSFFDVKMKSILLHLCIFLKKIKFNKFQLFKTIYCDDK